MLLQSVIAPPKNENELAAPRAARVLLVDDNEELLNVVGEILSRSSFETLMAASAIEAFQLLATSAPDIIVCDVMMPEKDGYEFFREVRQNPDWADIPFIFLTSLAGREEVQQGKGSGSDDYLTKPFDPDELVAVVRGKLSLSEYRKRNAQSSFESYRKRIIHTLSHEFRTPLVSINTGTELLLDRGHPLTDEMTKRLLESIQRGGYRLERLVNDFMLLQQIDLGHAASSCERFRRRQALLLLVQSAVESFQESFPGKSRPENISICASPEAEDVWVDVYDVQVAHIVQNLLSNAFKFGGEKSPIEVHLSVVGEEVLLAIRDHGPGLENHLLKDACKLFQQINRETHEQQGAGLGLTISNYFAQINNGSVSFVAPQDGKGLVAELRLPVVEASR